MHIGENSFLKKEEFYQTNWEKIGKIMGCPIFAKLPTPLILFCPILLDPPNPPLKSDIIYVRSLIKKCKQNSTWSVQCNRLPWFLTESLLRSMDSVNKDGSQYLFMSHIAREKFNSWWWGDMSLNRTTFNLRANPV